MDLTKLIEFFEGSAHWSELKLNTPWERSMRNVHVTVHPDIIISLQTHRNVWKNAGC
jgi:hypothetical protein